MKYSEFRAYLAKFSKKNDVKFPYIKERHELHTEYELSLYTAPIDDCKETLEQFLMSKLRLAPLPVAVPAISKAEWSYQSGCKIKEEGKTPMRYNDNYASANVITTIAQSDTTVQRDYLLGRLSRADYPKQAELGELFNLYVNNTPKTYKELIAAIKNDKFTIDKKAAKRMEVMEENEEEDCENFYFSGPFSGIIWDGPKQDSDGYTKACEEKDKQFRAAKDIIMSGVYMDGLKALQAFEAWLPSVTASSDTAH